MKCCYYEIHIICPFVSEMLLIILCIRLYYMCSSIWAYQFCYHGNLLTLDLPDVKGFANHLWHSVWIFAWSAWSSKHIYRYVRSSLWLCLIKLMLFELKVTKNIEIRLGRLEKSELPWETIFFIVAGVFPTGRTIYSLPSFNGLRWKLTKIALFIYVTVLVLYCLE